jgi:hypothetical protein
VRGACERLAGGVPRQRIVHRFPVDPLEHQPVGKNLE